MALIMAVAAARAVVVAIVAAGQVHKDVETPVVFYLLFAEWITTRGFERSNKKV